MVTAGKGARIACLVGSCAALKLGQQQLCLSVCFTHCAATHAPPPSTRIGTIYSRRVSQRVKSSVEFFRPKFTPRTIQMSRLPLVLPPPHSVFLPGSDRFKIILVISLTCGKANGPPASETTRLAGSPLDCSILFASLAATHKNRSGFVAALHMVRSTPFTLRYLAVRAALTVHYTALYTFPLAKRPKQVAEGVSAFWAHNQIDTVLDQESTGGIRSL